MSEFEVGDLCWAKMKGFSPWPAMVVDPIKKMKPPPKSKTVVTHYCVLFFGTKQYAWIPENDMLSFEDGTEKFKIKKFSGSLKKAVDEMKAHAEKFPQMKRKKPESANRKSGSVKDNNSSASHSKPSSGRSSPESSLMEEIPSTSSGPRKIKKAKSIKARKKSPSVEPAISRSFDFDQGRELEENQNPPPKIGFLGLGVMGTIIVRHLMKSDPKRELMVWNRTISKCDEFLQEGVKVGKTAGEVTEACDIIFSCLSDPQAVKHVVTGDHGVLNSMSKNKGYVEMSTIDPDTSQQIAKAIASKNGRYLEVPILGTRKQAEEATLVLLTAGDRELFKDCKSCFQDIGEHVFFLGDVGNASKMNLVINMVLGTCFAAVAEAMDLAERSGISQRDAVEILERGKLNCPAIINQGNAIIKAQFKDANIRLEHMQKNLHLALEIADQLSQPIPTVAIVNEVFTQAKHLGYGKCDVSAISSSYSSCNDRI